MSEKNRDDKNRWRNVTIAFRMSPEENEELNNRVKLSDFVPSRIILPRVFFIKRWLPQAIR